MLLTVLCLLFVVCKDQKIINFTFRREPTKEPLEQCTTAASCSETNARLTSNRSERLRPLQRPLGRLARERSDVDDAVARLPLQRVLEVAHKRDRHERAERALDDRRRVAPQRRQHAPHALQLAVAVRHNAPRTAARRAARRIGRRCATAEAPSV